MQVLCDFSSTSLCVPPYKLESRARAFGGSAPALRYNCGAMQKDFDEFQLTGPD